MVMIMIKVEVIKDFTYKDFDNIKDTLKRASGRNEEGKLYVGDTFKCSKQVVEYLMGKNEEEAIVIKVIEVIPNRVSKKKK